ncbi:MAG: hypothetical protein B7X10_04355 [Burkholderiales bacterium 21-58-4]|nr:MAG: hypothetical protein B7X10_04355 [Burkholderiales bacterium 21-58-4]
MRAHFAYRPLSTTDQNQAGTAAELRRQGVAVVLVGQRLPSHLGQADGVHPTKLFLNLNPCTCLTADHGAS